MPTVTASDGVRLNYEAAGSGRPVLLMTGAFSSLADWQESGVFDELASERRVIAMDLRGHGDGDKPHDPASYGMRRNAQDAAAVLEAEGAQGADVYGFSMGGHVALAMLHGDRSRVRSIAGSGVMVPPPNFPMPAEPVMLRARSLREKGLCLDAINADGMLNENPPAGPWLERALAGDARAYIAEAEAQALMEDQQLPPSGPPVLLIAGEHDGLAVALCRDLPQRFAYVRFHQLDGRGHFAGVQRDVLPVLREFWRSLEA